MRVITYTEARNNFKQALDATIDDVDVTIVHRRGGKNAVIMGQDQYNSMVETLYLLSNPHNARMLEQAIAEHKAGKAKRRTLLEA